MYGLRLQSLASFAEGLGWVGCCFQLGWAMICLVVGLLPFGLMSGFFFVMFLVYFKLIFYVIPTCPPANEQLPKLVELVSYNP